MNAVEQPQLPLAYALRISSVAFLINSLDGLHAEARELNGPLALITSSYYLLVSIALCWAHPGSFWYRPGCWLQPLPGRNLILCGPAAVLRRFRLYAARLGLVLCEDSSRGEGATSISLQSYWALPNNIWMDMAQLDLLTFAMPLTNLFAFLAGGQARHPPFVEGVGSAYYIPTLLGVTDQDPRLYLALRRRNSYLGRNPDRARPGVLESMAVLCTLVRRPGIARQVLTLHGGPINRVLGLAEEDRIIFGAADNHTSYNNQVSQFDRDRTDQSLFGVDLEHLNDLELNAMGYDSEGDEDFDDYF
ncbi:putative 34K protein [Alfalfa enamovirus 2]|nr:putative 34K protein [Alfalfa enamovirus 2]